MTANLAARLFVLVFAVGFIALGLSWVRLYRRMGDARERIFAVSRIVCVTGGGVSLAVGALARSLWAFGAFLGFMVVAAAAREWLVWQVRRADDGP
jgi:hypothetical protein